MLLIPVVLGAIFFVLSLSMGLISVPALNINVDKIDLIANLQNTAVAATNDESTTDNLITDELLDELNKNTNDNVSTNKKAVRLKVTSVGIDGPIVYGEDPNEMLKQGFWNYTAGANPGDEGSAIIFGHRIHHVPPATDTFYNLDKVKVGDMIEVEYEDGTRDYFEVVGKSINGADDFSILSQAKNASYVKLVTCDNWDVWDERIVVTAKKIVQ